MPHSEGHSRLRAVWDRREARHNLRAVLDRRAAIHWRKRSRAAEAKMGGLMDGLRAGRVSPAREASSRGTLPNRLGVCRAAAAGADLSVAHVVFAGDCALGPSLPATGVLSGFLGARPDLLVLNLECADAAGEPRSGRRAILKLDPDRLADLRAGAETTVCVLANNHVTDFGPRGVLSTLRRTANAGLLTVGAGADIQAARRPPAAAG